MATSRVTITENYHPAADPTGFRFKSRENHNPVWNNTTKQVEMCRPRYRSVARLRSLVWKSLRSLFRIVAIAPLYIAFASLTCCLLGAASRYHIGGGGVPRLHVYSSPQNFPSLACGLFLCYTSSCLNPPS